MASSSDTWKSYIYGWAPVNSRGYIQLHLDQIDMSFLCAVSKDLFYGVIGLKGTTTGQCLIKFIRQLCESRRSRPDLDNKKFILVCDNASVNISSEVTSFISSSKLRMMTINAY